jgi:hypothetical protein
MVVYEIIKEKKEGITWCDWLYCPTEKDGIGEKIT